MSLERLEWLFLLVQVAEKCTNYDRPVNSAILFGGLEAYKNVPSSNIKIFERQVKELLFIGLNEYGGGEVRKQMKNYTKI